MNNVIKIKHQLTGLNIYFAYGKKAHKKVLLKKFQLDDSYTGDAATTIVENNNSLIGFVVSIDKEIKDVYQIKSLLVHEISHVVTSIMDKYEFSCDEFRSYNMQFLYIEMVKFLDNLLKGIK